MRRSSPLTILLFALPAALFARAAFAQTPSPCLDVDPGNLLPAVEAADLIVIARVQTGGEDGAVSLDPEAYLKGPATGTSIPLSAANACGQAALGAADRVLVFLSSADGAVAWPEPGAVFWFEDGTVSDRGEPPFTSTEAALVEDIRTLTGQYAVPAGPDEGASIEWLGTVAWVAGALVIVLGISLVLLRSWHRIDPS